MRRKRSLKLARINRERKHYKRESHILAKQLEQADRHIQELIEIIDNQNTLIDHHINNGYRVGIRVENSSNNLN